MNRCFAVLPVVALAACSRGARHSDAASWPTMAVLHAQVVTSGALRSSDTYTSTTGPDGAATCPAAVSDGNASNRQFVVASPGSFSAPVYFGFRTVSYRGPATYRHSGVRLDSVAAVIDRRSEEFRPTSASTVSMTVHRDGTGSAAFTAFRSATGAQLNAVVTWHCTTEPA